MKTVSSPSECRDVLSDNVSSCLPSKTASSGNNDTDNFISDVTTVAGLNHNDIETRTSFQGDSDNAIKCNLSLSSGLQNGKFEGRIIRPGHYLQKVFFSSAVQKSKSRSLPSCVDEKNKCNVTSNECFDDTSVVRNEINCSLQNNCPTIGIRDSEINHCSALRNETKFKTWPERGVDKHFSKRKKCNHVLNIENQGYHLSDNNLINDTIKEHNEIENGSLKYKNDGSIQPVETTGCNSPVHISQVLESISLGYSPITKQLHIISDSDKSKLVNYLPNFSKDKQEADDHENKRLDSCCLETKCDNKSYCKGCDTLRGLVKECATEHFTVRQGVIGDKIRNSLVSGDSVSLQGSNTVNNGDNFNHVGTNPSSFSSTVSSLSDISPSTTNDDSALGSLVNLDHGDSCSLASIGECSILSEDSAQQMNKCIKSKKKGFSGFFTRNVFNWKSSNENADNQNTSNWLGAGMVLPDSSLSDISSYCSGKSGSTWKLFSRNSNLPGSATSSMNQHNVVSRNLTGSTLSECQSGGGGSSTVPGSPCSVKSGHKSLSSHENIIANSTTALIQLDRPSSLPAKSQEELERHRQQYQDMLDAAKKKDLKEAKQRKRELQLQLRIEEQQAQAARTWNQEILPKWDTMCSSRKTRELWWNGIPPCVRGKVWRLAISNELNLTPQLFDICCLRAREMLKMCVDIGDVDTAVDDSADNKEASVQLIRLDISRTFPNLCIFQQGGPYYDMLHCLLGAYVCYRPDVGYVQGMSFIAAVLILNMEVADAFICFANVLNRPCHMAFFSLNQPMMQAYYSTYNDLLCENLPQVYKHFVESHLTPDLYLLDWIYTVFTKAMNLDLACRVWDVFLRDGEEFIFRTALGVLSLYQNVLLKMDFIRGSQYLTRLPDDLPQDQLFRSIRNIKMSVGKQTFEQILAFHVQKTQNNCSLSTTSVSSQ